MNEKRWEDFEKSLSEDWQQPTIVGMVIKRMQRLGWGIVYPEDWPNLCVRCRTLIEPGTVHNMFNGNQMFACVIEKDLCSCHDFGGGPIHRGKKCRCNGGEGYEDHYLSGGMGHAIN
jgi:hypothetical protein